MKGIINRSVSTETQENPHQNRNVDIDNGKLFSSSIFNRYLIFVYRGQFDAVTGDVDGQNDHPAVDNYQQGLLRFFIFFPIYIQIEWCN